MITFIVKNLVVLTLFGNIAFEAVPFKTSFDDNNNLQLDETLKDVQRRDLSEFDKEIVQFKDIQDDDVKVRLKRQQRQQRRRNQNNNVAVAPRRQQTQSAAKPQLVRQPQRAQSRQPARRRQNAQGQRRQPASNRNGGGQQRNNRNQAGSRRRGGRNRPNRNNGRPTGGNGNGPSNPHVPAEYVPGEDDLGPSADGVPQGGDYY